MRRNIPTRVVETGRVVRGPSGQGVGWLQSLADRFRNLRAQVQGINERLTSPLGDGFPSAVTGELVFQADTNTTITIANYPTEPDEVPPIAFIALNVNPIIRAGQTYRVPITFSPPGVFMAHNLVVGIEAGFTMFNNQMRPGITPLNDYREVKWTEGISPQGGAFVPPPDIGAMQYTYQQQVLGDFADVVPYLPYFWNIVDEKSGRQYAQDWMPCGALMNTRANVPFNIGTKGCQPIPDSELFEFDTPWIFERDAQVAFLFRPLMDLYQIDAADAQAPYGGIKGLSGGRRVEQATVRVEFHGNRYYERQDIFKDGAYVTNARDPSQKNIPNP